MRWGDFMVLDLRQVFLNDGERLAAEYELDLSELSFYDVYPLEEPVKVNACVANEAGAVSISIAADVSYDAPCDRCGERTVTQFNFSFEHTLVQSLAGENDGEYVVLPDYKLDLDELVMSDVVLELPLKHLCREDCKGLCPKCGRNLNRQICSCDMTDTDPRLEALKDLLD